MVGHGNGGAVIRGFACEGEGAIWSRAARIIRDRIRGLPEFSELRGALVRDAIKACRGKDVPAMRQLGGFSSVLCGLIDALPAALDANAGSKLLHMSVKSELRAEVPAMRFEVQRALAREWRAA